jgi:hypothetical protein
MGFVMGRRRRWVFVNWSLLLELDIRFSLAVLYVMGPSLGSLQGYASTPPFLPRCREVRSSLYSMLPPWFFSVHTVLSCAFSPLSPSRELD